MKLQLCGISLGMMLSFAIQAATVNTANIGQIPLNGPWDIAVSGNSLYVTDTINDMIRVVDIPTGKMSGFPISGSRLYRPDGIAVAGRNIFVGDSGRITKIALPGNVASVLTGIGRSGSADGVGSAASLNSPSGLVVDGNNLYVADAGNHNIRKINISTGEVTTLCGSGKKDAIDGSASIASLSPWGITKVGNYLYATDFENNRIRKIDINTGFVSTFAGGEGKGFRGAGAEDGIGTAASFYNPWGITTEGRNLYVADSSNNKIRKIVIATGEVSTLAGGDGTGLNGAGLSDGIGTSASFNRPAGITTDGSNLYVVDRDNNTIRKIDISTRTATTVLGQVFVATSKDPLANKLLKEAEGGDISAQFKLGEIYSKEDNKIGESIDPDTADTLQRYKLENAKKEKLRLALQWYLKAAEQGHARAQYQVAKLSGDGIYPVSGKPVDFIKWYTKAAEQGVPEAEEAMGYFYATGIRVGNNDIHPDLVEAFKWNLKAARQGMVNAQLSVGGAYEHGQGVSKDTVEAAKWYLKAANKGYVVAQSLLGCLLVKGSPSDYVQAFMWLELVWSSAQGWDYDTACSNDAAKVMTPEQREQAKQLAGEWRDKHPVVEH